MIISTEQAILLLQRNSHPKQAPFLVFEGINGSGKSTLLNIFKDQLAANQIDCQVSREPGATDLGLKLRQLLLESNGTSLKIDPLAELLLFAADRAQHVKQLIKPAIQGGKVALSDRYHYSTLAFQGYGRGLPINEITQINSIATANLDPDLVILLDLSAHAGIARTLRREESSNLQGGDIFEKEMLDFHDKVRHGYLSIAKTSPTPFLVLDATQTVAELAATVLPLAHAMANSLNTRSTTYAS